MEADKREKIQVKTTITMAVITFLLLVATGWLLIVTYNYTSWTIRTSQTIDIAVENIADVPKMAESIKDIAEAADEATDAMTNIEEATADIEDTMDDVKGILVDIEDILTNIEDTVDDIEADTSKIIKLLE
jgi:methyl-accepting chemotaxis protein